MKPLTIKPIETRFTGYRFRSRLEARWAVFFETLGLQWEYEPEGFELSDGRWYLPDFRVRAAGGIEQWYEVKPTAGSDDRKLDRLADDLRQARVEKFHAKTLVGDPVAWFANDPNACVCPRCGSVHGGQTEVAHAGDLVVLYCWPCDITTTCGGGHDTEQGLLAPGTPHKGFVLLKPDDWRSAMRKVREAAKAARSARFEHGEKGIAR